MTYRIKSLWLFIKKKIDKICPYKFNWLYGLQTHRLAAWDLRGSGGFLRRSLVRLTQELVGGITVVRLPSSIL